MKIESPEFREGESIPAKYTCQQTDINPPLTVCEVGNATSLVLIVDDPDAPIGTWVHWVVWNISPEIKSINEDSVPEGATQGKNSWGRNKYGGPCPPSGTHRYFFKIYALDIILNLPVSTNKKNLLAAIAGHIISEAQLMGSYQKR